MCPALAMYEYLITIDQEISHFWKSKVSLASLNLIAVRWTMVLTAILNIVIENTSSVRLLQVCHWLSTDSLFTGVSRVAFRTAIWDYIVYILDAPGRLSPQSRWKGSLWHKSQVRGVV